MGRMVRVLVIDDDEGIRGSLRLALEDEGYAVDDAESGEAALERFAAHPADVVLLDLMLPGMDGYECCRRLRRSSDVPIIVVSARTDTHDIVAGLEAGADDFVSKPFVMKELSARLRAMRRRIREEPTDGFTSGELRVVPDEGSVRRGDEELHLTKTEFRLLCELGSAPGRVFSRETLLERVWEYDYFGDARIVDVHVRRLRTKIEPDPSSPRHVVTVRGLGYKLQP
jgi:DNA-binding response OmpR family regulator